MAKRSQGIKRIVFMISILCGIGWISFIGIMSDGFSGFSRVDASGFSQENREAWFFSAAGFAVVYFIPQLICRVVYWVIDGFRKDGET